MDIIQGFLGNIMSMGAGIIIPVVITIFALCLKIEFGKSIRAGLTAGVGFTGLNLVIGLLVQNIEPVAKILVTKYGLSLSVIDVGWPSASTIAFGTSVGAFIIPLCLGINILMLLTKTTQTVGVDIWNYWHFAFTGSMVMGITGNFRYGIIAAGLNMIIIQVIADLTAPSVEKHLGFAGISMPHGFSAAYVPVAILLNKLIDMIPIINKIDVDLESLKKRIGVIGEPIIMGTLIGVVMGMVAGYDAKGVMDLGIKLAAALVLMPKMTALLMEGLLPVSTAAQELVQKKYGSSGKLYIGLDSAIGVGNQATLTIAILMIPITILLAVVLPGNQVLPFGDLATIPFALVLIIPITKGNMFRTLIIAIFIMASGLLISTNMAAVHTMMAIRTGFELPAKDSMVSSICDGGNPISWLFTRGSEIGIWGLSAMGVLALVLLIYNGMRIRKINHIENSSESLQ